MLTDKVWPPCSKKFNNRSVRLMWVPNGPVNDANSVYTAMMIALTDFFLSLIVGQQEIAVACPFCRP